MWNHFDAGTCPGKAVGVRVRLDNGVMGFIGIKNLSDSPVINPAERVQQSNYFKKLLQFCCTVTIWIPDSFENRALWVSSIQMVKSCDLADNSNTRHFDFFSSVFRPPFEYNQTQIYHSNTGLVQYSDGYCILLGLNKNTKLFIDSLFIVDRH